MGEERPTKNRALPWAALIAEIDTKVLIELTGNTMIAHWKLGHPPFSIHTKQ